MLCVCQPHPSPPLPTPPHPSPPLPTPPHYSPLLPTTPHRSAYRSDFVYDLFEHMALSDTGQGPGGSGIGRRMSLKRKGGRKKATVSSQFKDSLHSLMTTLGQANPYFVRCIKPNMMKVRPHQWQPAQPASCPKEWVHAPPKEAVVLLTCSEVHPSMWLLCPLLSVCLSVCLQSANSFHPQTVLNQLKYSGMMETVRIRRAGYPVRRTFEDFLHRYHIFARTQAGGGEPKGRCTRLVQMYDPEGANWQMGLTKVGATLSSPSPPLSLPLPAHQVFMREVFERLLEREREVKLRAVCRVIYNVVLTFNQR